MNQALVLHLAAKIEKICKKLTLDSLLMTSSILLQALKDFRGHVEEIPCVVGGREVYTGDVQTRECVCKQKDS